MNRLRIYLSLAILVGYLNASLVMAAPPAYNIQLTVANEETENTDDTYQQLTASVRYGKGLTRNSVLNLNADIYTRAYSDLEESDRNGLLAEIFYSYIPTDGFTKPVYSVGLRQENETFDDSDKDSSETSLILATNIRIDDQVSFAGGLEFIDKSTDILDTSTSGLFLNLDFRLSDKTIIYTNLKLQQEESSDAEPMSNLTPQTAVRDLIGSSHLPGEPGYTGPSTGANAEFDNTSIVLGVNYFIESRHAIDISYERVEYDSDTDTTREILSFDYFYKFN